MRFLLTLDLATHCGWTYGEPEDIRFAYGTHTLPSTGEDVGSFLAAFRDWLLAQIIPSHRDAVVVFESPIMPAQTSMATLRKLYGLAGVTEMLCKDHDIKCMEVSAGSCRAFIGAKRTQGQDMKKAVIAAVERYGYEPDDDDQADAIAIRLYVIARMWPRLMPAFSLDIGLLGAAADN